jgi:hypothetical protein
VSWSRFRGNGPAWRVNLHEMPAPMLSVRQTEVPAPAPLPHSSPERGTLAPLARAPGDKLKCAELTREAAIEVMRLCGGGPISSVIREKLESGQKPGGPEQTDVIAWLCRNGFAWRPRNATTEARLTAKGQAKAKSVLIHVSAGNY